MDLMRRIKMTDDDGPMLLGVEKVVENEDGSATYTFHMSDAAAEEMQALGLKMVLYCGVTRTDIEDVFEWILEQRPGED
jgi:NADH:ubiquinone oxidoreductase subunit K